MNAFDIIVIALLVWAAFCGFKNGLIVQVGSLAAIIIGMWLASTYGTEVGLMLGVSSSSAPLVGLIVVFIATLICAAIVSRIVRSLFSAVGLGAIDKLCGAALSIIKYLAIMVIAVSAFDGINHTHKLVEQSSLDKSYAYTTMAQLSYKLFPSLKWLENQAEQLYNNVTE